MSIISSIMIRAFMISISSSQIRLLFRTLAATIPTADRTGLLSAEKCRRHLSAGTDSGRAGLFYHIATSCSSPAEESLLSCCYSGRISSKCSCINAPGFVKQRIRSPDTLFFYAQAGQNGCRRRRPFGLTDQMVRSLASASLGGRRMRSERSPQKASASGRSRAAPPVSA